MLPGLVRCDRTACQYVFHSFFLAKCDMAQPEFTNFQMNIQYMIPRKEKKIMYGKNTKILVDDFTFEINNFSSV